MAKRIEMENKQFGDWLVLHRDDTKKNVTYYICECLLCHNTYSVNAATIRRGESTCCKKCSLAKNKEDLTGKVFGKWKVISYVGSRNEHTYWLCECLCENKTRREVDAGALKNGHSTSCGCVNRSRHIDLTGQHIGEWTVKRYDRTENNMAYWLCECSCGVQRSVLAASLLNKRSLSCGHDIDIKDRKFGQLTAKKYVGLLGKNNDQPAWLCECSCGKEITVFLGNLTSGQSTSCGHDRGFSNAEKEVVDYIKSLGITIKENDRTILAGKELDIYCEEQHLAIEYNGVYWHSDLYKDENYHLYKTAACAKKSVDLIHIFEHEWLNLCMRQKLQELLKAKLNISQKIIYARKTKVQYVTNKEDLRNFLDKYHLQGYVASQTALGLYYDNELIEVMTFGKPRFNKSYDVELLRLCTKHGYKVIGGAAKLLQHYAEEHHNEKLITYCDLSKFTGRVYEQLGMKQIQITKPNYVYVKAMHDTFEIKTRYQCQKHKLVKAGLDEYGDTEYEIMSNLGYVRVYDCGNVVYSYLL